jgi:cation:H+ antiporter
MFVNSAKNLGVMIGISDKIVGITILAFGTSLPELATCITAIVKKRSQMALGDIIGSNIFNILLISGTASMVQPLGFTNINIVDLIALALSTFMLYISQYTKHPGKFTRLDGGIMIAIFVAYMILLFKL